jgi:Lipoprotein LpqB beta-propeller domain/Sporulation and spore germination
MRRAVQALLAAVALLAVSSCMSVPDSGPVLAGPAVGSDDEPVLRYVPDGPRRGADPVEVINGYLDAMRAYPANPGIVRQFLTERAGETWNPGSGTRILTTRPELEQRGQGAVLAETGLVATLTERGAWSRPEQSQLRQVFRLRRERGQWRITNPADGLLLPEYDFERYYRAFSLYFFDPARRVLVPDPVYLPQGDQTASLLLRGLVRGPTEWLRGAVSSVVPATPPADLAVPVSDDGVAQVQLGSSARGLGAAERDLLAAQLAWTLRQVPDIDALRVTVNGAPLLLDGESTVTAVDVGADYDPADSAASQALFALRDDRVVTVDAFQGLSDRLPGRFGSGEVPVSAFAVERSAQTVAAVTEDGSTVEVAPIGAEESQEWFTRGRSLLGVQWDIHGLLWAVDRTPTGPSVQVLRDRRAARVQLREGPPRDIRAFALSRDGLRLAVVDGQGEQSRLMVGRVRRNPDAALEVSVDHWHEVGGRASTLRDFVDVAWGSPTQLTVVAEEIPGSPQTFAVSVDGSAVEPAALVDLDLVAVADAPDTDVPAVVATLPGTLFVELSDRWSELALDGALRQPSYVE